MILLRIVNNMIFIEIVMSQNIPYSTNHYYDSLAYSSLLI